MYAKEKIIYFNKSDNKIKISEIYNAVEINYVQPFVKIEDGNILLILLEDESEIDGIIGWVESLVHINDIILYIKIRMFV